MSANFKSISILLFSFSIIFFSLKGDQKPFVIGKLSCELGNNLFQVATTCAHAWDHDAEPFFPDLINQVAHDTSVNYAHVFFRCSSNTPTSPILYKWMLPVSSNFCYTPIPYRPNMLIDNGTYQSEKFFLHHRERLLNLFAPHPDDLAYIKTKYAKILDHPYTVGIQMRWFGREIDKAWNEYLVQLWV